MSINNYKKYIFCKTMLKRSCKKHFFTFVYYIYLYYVYITFVNIDIRLRCRFDKTYQLAQAQCAARICRSISRSIFSHMCRTVATCGHCQRCCRLLSRHFYPLFCELGFYRWNDSALLKKSKIFALSVVLSRQKAIKSKY